MKVQQEQHGAVMVVSATGRVDSSTAKTFENAVIGAIGAGDCQLLLDLGGVDYMSSAGLRVLLMAAKRAKAGGGRFVLCSLNPRVQEVIEIAGFTSVLDIRTDRAGALADW